MSNSQVDIIEDIINALIKFFFNYNKNLSNTIKRNINNENNSFGREMKKYFYNYDLEKQVNKSETNDVYVEEKPAEIFKPETEQRMPELKVNSSYNSKSSEKNLAINFKNEDITKAFIYSEVFGAPKCRRKGNGRW